MAAPEVLTERLILTSLRNRDALALFEYRSDPEISRYQSWEPRSVGDALRFINEARATAYDTPGTWSQFAIRPRSSEDALVGDLGVHFPAAEPRQAEVGVTIAPGHQRRGFASEAIEGLLGNLFGALQKHRVLASVDPRNEASVALLERVGMRQEAHFRESLWFKDEWVDDLVFAILKSEWERRLTR